MNNSEYFLSTNFHPYLTEIENLRITDQLSTDLLPILQQLQTEGTRGNVGFDLLYQRSNDKVKAYILESNGIHRTTGSTLPNSFAYNTDNKLFIWIPLSARYLAEWYNSFNKESLTALSQLLQSAGTDSGKPQIMNMRYEWVTSWYPVVWIASSWNTINELYDLYLKLGFLNTLGEKYVKDLFVNLA